MTTMSPFRTRLEQAVNARHSRMNPFTEKWVNGELTRTQLGQWVCQHYQYVSQFARWCATVYGTCPDPDARDFLLENIIEEESGTKHVDLLIRFGEACGVSRAEVESARQLPSTRALTAWCYETARKPSHVAAASSTSWIRASARTRRARRATCSCRISGWWAACPSSMPMATRSRRSFPVCRACSAGFPIAAPNST